jgi:hypothetical protein
VRGAQYPPRAAPLFEAGAITTDAVLSGWRKHTAGNGVIYSYVMNNYWETNYKADQPGVTIFRYVLFPHRGFEAAANMRRSMEASQPLLALPSTAGFALPPPPLRLDNDEAAVG